MLAECLELASKEKKSTGTFHCCQQSFGGGLTACFTSVGSAWWQNNFIAKRQTKWWAVIQNLFFVDVDRVVSLGKCSRWTKANNKGTAGHLVAIQVDILKLWRPQNNLIINVKIPVRILWFSLMCFMASCRKLSLACLCVETEHLSQLLLWCQ